MPCSVREQSMSRELHVALPRQPCPEECRQTLTYPTVLHHSPYPTWHPQGTLTCMLAVASPSMPPKVMALVTVAR